MGLTGGYATGKSFVASELGRLGCHIISADEIGHQVLEPGGSAYEPAVARFGKRIVGPAGKIDRKKLAALVFGDPAKLEELNRIVHPAVIAAEQAIVDQIRARDARAIVVLEAAILIEIGRHSAFDRLIVTVCDREIQIARGMDREGASREDVLARIARQMPSEEKRKFADYIIDTGGTRENTLAQVREIYCSLREVASAQ